MYWRFAERWRIDLGYFSLNRNGTRTLDTQIDWGGNTYPIGTIVNSNYKLSDLRAAVGYSFSVVPTRSSGSDSACIEPALGHRLMRLVSAPQARA
jgi:hypothetical protein